MKGTSRFTIAAGLLAALVVGCAEMEDPTTRPSLADGGTRSGGTDSTLQAGQGSVTCQAGAASSPVVSGVPFRVNVRLTNGTIPYAVVGFVEGVSTEWTEITAAITSGSGSTVMVTRKITVRDAKGVAGTCAFSVAVSPT